MIVSPYHINILNEREGFGVVVKFLLYKGIKVNQCETPTSIYSGA